MKLIIIVEGGLVQDVISDEEVSCGSTSISVKL